MHGAPTHSAIRLNAGDRERKTERIPVRVCVGGGACGGEVLVTGGGPCYPLLARVWAVRVWLVVSDTCVRSRHRTLFPRHRLKQTTSIA